MKNSYCMMFALSMLFVVGCASQKSVEYPRANKVQENAHSLYEENKEWAKETAEQVVNTTVDYAAVGAAKAGEAYDVVSEKAEDWKNRFKKRVDEYKNRK